MIVCLYHGTKIQKNAKITKLYLGTNSFFLALSAKV